MRGIEVGNADGCSTRGWGECAATGGAVSGSGTLHHEDDEAGATIVEGFVGNQYLKRKYARVTNR